MTMKSAATAGFAFILALAPGLGPAVAAAAVEPSVVSADVRVVAAPITSDSKPFGSLGGQPSKYGYIEEEFFVSGAARAYDWDGRGFSMRAISAPGPYTIRILVLRPGDPKKFSGNAEVELLNSSRGYDSSITLETSADLIMARGDVFIGVTSKALAVNALKRFDPKRYADLAWSNPVPEAYRCPAPTIFPSFMKGGAPDSLLGSNSASEDGLIYEIYAQVGAFLKSNRRGVILPGFARPRLFSTGTSQSGMLQRTYVNAFHPVLRLPGGGPIYDGYLIEVAPGAERINQCSEDIFPGDPRNLLRRVDAPIINILSEGDMWLGRYNRQPNRIARRSGLVRYEVAGGAHLPGMSRATEASDVPAGRGGGDPVFPRGYVSRAALIHLQRWAGAGETPPAGRLLQIRDRRIVRDVNGNAVGGVRSVWLDAPIARYEGSTGVGEGAVTGRRTPFSPEKVRELYPTREVYAAKVKSVADKLISEGWLLKQDEGAVVSNATSQVLSSGLTDSPPDCSGACK